jgi:hypothetical protein
MQITEFPWNAKNSNVLIVAGNHYEYFALKYGVCIMPVEARLIPCKYLAIYENETIKHLFEVIKNPYGNVEKDNLTEFREILELEKDKKDEWLFSTESWIKPKDKCIFITIKKIADVGPIINDYISPRTGKIHPLTRGTPRYSLLDKIKKAKLTSELECNFDNDDPLPPPKPVVVPPPPPPPPTFWELYGKYIIMAIIALIVIGTGIYFFLNKEPQTVVLVKEVEKKAAPKRFELPESNFSVGKAELNEQSEQTLKTVLTFIKEYDNLQMNIIGHTDNVGKEDKNIELSLERAETVKQWFIKSGIASDRIKTEGKGSLEPKADNSTLDGRKVNRRVEIIISSK